MSAGDSGMKVVHLSTTDFGGAYKAAARISESMRQCGVDSKLLIRTKTRRDTEGIEIFTNPAQKLVSKMKNLVNLILSEGEVVSDYLGTNVSRHPLVKEADVVILHWVNSFISYKNVEQLLRTGKPLIWVMHDMWLFTGGCHIDHYCGGYEHGCGKCPYINRKNPKENDISRRNLMRKIKMMDRGAVTLVAPSTWSADCAGYSEITKRQEIIKIPNPIDKKVFYKRADIRSIKEKYKIPINKKVILFGAMNSDKDRNKGMKYLNKALCKISEKEYVIVIFGNSGNVSLTNKKLEIICLGMIGQEEEMAQVYNCADVLVVPSMQESFGYTVCEALACEVPVVAFAVGGILDQIKHKENGYLVPLGEVGELTEGIKFCTKDDNSLLFGEHSIPDNNFSTIGKAYLDLCMRKLTEKNYEKDYIS